MTWRSLCPLPPRTQMTLRSRSRSQTFRLVASDTRSPAPYRVARIARWPRFFGASSKALTSSLLRMTGSFFSYLGNGIRSISILECRFPRLPRTCENAPGRNSMDSKALNAVYTFRIGAGKGRHRPGELRARVRAHGDRRGSYFLGAPKDRAHYISGRLSSEACGSTGRRRARG